MWEKWAALATLASSTCLMRASVGDIVSAPAGKDLILGIFGECSAIAAAHGHAPRAPVVEKMQATLTQAGSPLTASMLRDLEGGGRTEADHIVGDLLARRSTPADSRLSPLQIAYAHLKAHEARQARESALSAGS